MRRSLRTRWTLALVAVCVLEAALVAVAMRVSTARTFDRFVVAESFDLFASRIEATARSTGTISAESEADTPPPGGIRPPRPRPRGSGPPRPPRETQGQLPPPSSLGRDIAFGLADAEGRVVQPFDGHSAGDVLATDVLASGRALMVNDELVGTAFIPKDATAALSEFPPRSPEARFIASSTSALATALALALALAVGLGVWLTGRTVRPIRHLTDAARGIASGEFGRSVQVSRDDEVGALAEAFNTMSAQLAEATALRQRMTADVSHDLRTPVTAVLGTLELIETGVLEPTPERIRAARIQAERLARLVESFHTLAIADAGELPVHAARVSPANALHHTATLFEAQAETAGVEIVVEVDGAPDVRADPDRLAQVLGNLVSNALRHTPSGGRVTLAARLVSPSESSGEVEIAVSDTGEGIAPGVLPHVFERSVRADGARSGEGAGLGLSIVRSLTEAMGGAVGVVSAPGAGTTVTVTLRAWSTSTDAS